jgi:hypothetical protein
VLFVTAIILAVWALVALGVVLLCVAARRADLEIAGELSAAPRVAAAPTRAPIRLVSP